MKRIRMSLVVLLFAAAQMPSQANCQLLAFTSAAQCAMPCCRHLAKSMPMSAKCPMLKAAPQTADAITPHAHFLSRVSDALRILPKLWAQDMAHTFSRLPLAVDIFHLIYVERPSLGRSPPANVVLLSA